MKKDAPLDAVLALTPDQVGQLIGFCGRTVDTMIATGELPAVRIRGVRRVLRCDLERWLETQARLVPGEAGKVA